MALNGDAKFHHRKTDDYKKLEEQLRESEERFRGLVETSFDAIITIDLEGRITYIFFAAEKIMGYTPEEVIGKSFHIFFNESIVPEAIQGFAEVINGKTIRGVELELQRKDGSSVSVEMNGAPIIKDGKIVGIQVTARDITERKKAEEALRESEEKMRNILESSPDAITVADLDGNIVDCNQATLDMFGLISKEELIGKNDLLLIADKDRERLVENMKKTLKQGSTKNIEYTIASKNGHEFPIEVSASVVKDTAGNPRYFVAIWKDITQRKQMEQRITESEERLRQLIEFAPDAIYINDLNGVFIDGNKQAEDLAGYNKEELVGKSMVEVGLLPEKYLPKAIEMLQKNFNGERTGPDEFELVRKDGSTITVEISTFPVKRGEKTEVIGIARDITERKKMQERLSALSIFSRDLNTAKGMEEIYELTLNAAEKILGYEFADILIIEGKMLCLVTHRGGSKNLSLKLPLDGDKGITVMVARIGTPVYVPDVSKEQAYVEGGLETRSELAVPIKIGHSVLGVLNVESEKLDAFNKKDQELLEILASHVATAITNLSRQEKLATLNEYGKNLNMTKNLEELYTLTLNVMEKILGYEFATVFMVEQKNLRLTAHRGYPEKLDVIFALDEDRGVSVRATKTGKSVFVPDVREEKAYVPGRLGMLSELAVPMKIGENVLGVLNVESERLAAFDENDRELLEILASHTATAISNITKRYEIERHGSQLASLMKSSAEMIHSADLYNRLQSIVEAIKDLGWRRVVFSLLDENFDIVQPMDVVTSGVTEEEREYLWVHRATGQVLREQFGSEYDRFKIGEFYHLPWSDPFVKEKFTEDTIRSHLKPEEMVDWDPQDLLYAPLKLADGRIVGMVSIDDPVDGKRPTKESLAPLELFLYQAAVAIENAQLIRQQKEYMGHLEEKADERTRQLRETQEQLIKSERLAAIGEVAAMVGHDLRNPLTGIKGATYYLKTKLGPKMDEKTREMLELIENDVQHANRIITDLMEYTKEIRLELTETTPKSSVKEALSLVEVPEKIQLFDSSQTEPMMKMDLEKIKRVFANLIKNAIEAMPNGGKLTITSRESDNNVEFVFADTGIGMTKEVMKKLWTPFFTTKSKGMGLGLAICKRILEAHGGKITVESEVDKGTTFTVTIPIEPRTEERGEKIWVKTPESLLSTMTKA